MAIPPGVISCFLSLTVSISPTNTHVLKQKNFERDFCYRAHVLTRKTERWKMRNHSPEGMAMPQSLLLHSPLGILGTHAHAHDVSFKHPGPGRRPRSTTWESSDMAITLTAGSH